MLARSVGGGAGGAGAAAVTAAAAAAAGAGAEGGAGAGAGAGAGTRGGGAGGGSQGLTQEDVGVGERQAPQKLPVLAIEVRLGVGRAPQHLTEHLSDWDALHEDV